MNEALRLLLTSIGAAAVGALATIWTGAFGYWNTDRGQDIQMVNIALSILGGEIKDQDTSEPGRRFALRLLQKYAEVEIPDTEFDSWAKDGTLPETVYQAEGPRILPPPVTTSTVTIDSRGAEEIAKTISDLITKQQEENDTQQ